MRRRPETRSQWEEERWTTGRGKSKILGRWLMQEGWKHGLRVPTPEERAMGLGNPELHDAVGNLFDPRSFQQRIVGLLRDVCLAAEAGVYGDHRTPCALGIQAAFDRALACANSTA
eukprot:9499468-Pyramimonas_sp.AAC.1